MEWASDISSDTIGLIEASTILSALLIIPGLIYRFSVKSTAIIWSPLLWAVRSVSTAFGQIASSDACQRAANGNVVFRWPPAVSVSCSPRTTTGVPCPRWVFVERISESLPLEVAFGCKAADERRWPHRAAVALARVLDGGLGFALIRIARPSG